MEKTETVETEKVETTETEKVLTPTERILGIEVRGVPKTVETVTETEKRETVEK